ncbi:MAG TPA: hypothetical protein VHA37_08215, partial [Candidatus Saccharimonadales bacterium]|nr:hypothetical protein [Candidatus Saccharimonadales bacterium]
MTKMKTIKLKNPLHNIRQKRRWTGGGLALIAGIAGAAVLLAGGAYATINLSSQKPAQHQSLKPGINIDQGQKGLVGWWKLNGNAKDSTPYSNNGVLVNSPTPTTDRMGTPGGAMSFNGVNQQIRTNQNVSIVGNSPRTISVWFKWNGGSTPEGIV